MLACLVKHVPGKQFRCDMSFMQDLEAEIYSHVLEHHQAAVAGVADAIRDRKKQADGLEARAMAVLSKPLAWYGARVCAEPLHGQVLQDLDSRPVPRHHICGMTQAYVTALWAVWQTQSTPKDSIDCTLAPLCTSAAL